MNVKSRLCGNLRSISRFDADDILYFLCNPFRFGAWKVYLIDNGKNLKIMI